MMFNWIGACHAIVVLGIPMALLGGLFAMSEEEPVIATMFAVLLFALAFIAGGVPWEVV